MTALTVLFSSSRGNSAFVGSPRGGILIDAGVSAKRLTEALHAHNLAPSCLGAVFVTHEHADHVQGLRVFCERHRIPVFATAGTLAACQRAQAISPCMQADLLPPDGVAVGDLWVQPFRTSHDAAEPCGFCIASPDAGRIGIATDTGVLTPEAQAALLGCDTVLLESNHEISMLQNGNYPYFLKRRILADTGHLSNTACAAFLPALLRSGTCHFALGHLSRENNLPQLAEATALAALAAVGAKPNRDFVCRVCDS